MPRGKLILCLCWPLSVVILLVIAYAHDATCTCDLNLRAMSWVSELTCAAAGLTIDDVPRAIRRLDGRHVRIHGGIEATDHDGTITFASFGEVWEHAPPGPDTYVLWQIPPRQSFRSIPDQLIAEGTLHISPRYKDGILTQLMTCDVNRVYLPPKNRDYPTPWLHSGWGKPIPRLAGISDSLLVLCVIALTAIQLPRVTGFARRRFRHRHGLCPACNYDLRASPHRCPECGLRCQLTISHQSIN